MNSSDKSIYDKIKEERQNDRLTQELNNHNWLFNKIVTNSPSLKQNIEKESDSKGYMNIARKCTKKTSSFKKKKISVQKLDRSDSSQSQQKNTSDRSMPDLGDSITINTVAKLSKKRKNLVTSFPVLKKILNKEEKNTNTGQLTKHPESDNSNTPVDLRTEGEAREAQTPKVAQVRSSSLPTGQIIGQVANVLFSQESDLLIKHNLPLATVPERNRYRQVFGQPTPSGKRSKDQIECATDNKNKMDFLRIIQCLATNNITTVAQLIELLELKKTGEQITDEDRKMLKFLKDKQITTLEKLLQVIRDEDDIVFINEEIIPSDQKVVPVSQKKVKTLVAQSNENKKALDIIAAHEWCKKLVLQGVNTLNVEQLAIASGSGLEANTSPHQNSSVTENASSIAKPQEETAGVSVNAEKQIVPVRVSPVGDAVTRMEKNDSCSEIPETEHSKLVPLSDTSAPAYENSAPAPGTSSPAPGTSAPAPGKSAPAPGTSAPAPGKSAPEPGTSAPAPGTSAPEHGTSAPAPGTSAPAHGTSAPPEGASVIVNRQQSPLPVTKSNSTFPYPYTARHAMPQTVQRATSRGRRRGYAARDPRVRGQRQEKNGNKNAQNQLAQYNLQQANQNTQLVLHNASLQQHSSQPYGVNLPPHPPRPPYCSQQLSHTSQIQAQAMLRNTRQMSPQMAHHPPHNSHLIVSNHSNQIARASHHSPHSQQEIRGNGSQNICGHYGQDCLNYLPGSMGHNSPNMMYSTNNHMSQHSTYGGHSNQNYAYCQQWQQPQNPNHQHWNESSMTTADQGITCSAVASYTMAQSGCGNVTNNAVASHSIEDACMSLSAMANSTVADTTNYARQHHRHTTLAVAAAMHWTPPEMANLSGDHWQAHHHSPSTYRAQNRRTIMDPNAFNSNNENFPKASTGPIEPRIASIMPEWLWTSRRWPKDD